jgi:hypothetical protein
MVGLSAALSGQLPYCIRPGDALQVGTSVVGRPSCSVDPAVGVGILLGDERTRKGCSVLEDSGPVAGVELVAQAAASG